jgi:hypothetical protein
VAQASTCGVGIHAGTPFPAPATRPARIGRSFRLSQHCRSVLLADSNDSASGRRMEPAETAAFAGDWYGRGIRTHAALWQDSWPSTAPHIPGDAVHRSVILEILEAPCFPSSFSSFRLPLESRQA